MIFETVVGLEVHVQLNTRSKLFCSCAASFGDAPNRNVCPVCLGLPGALPVLNEEALKKAVLFGISVNGRINRNSTLARKNYFYPDLPKAYQISQFENPVVESGSIEIEVDGVGTKTIAIFRAHLEEDAGKSIHCGQTSMVDLNRAGIPLLEIVTSPDMRSADEAVAFLKKLHSIVRFLGISDANMQEGSFRCDTNVSIRPVGDSSLHTRVEVKNLNSFKFVGKAITYEVERQTRAWRDGLYEREVKQETRLFDPATGSTKIMRYKDDEVDYRYFSDPDLLMASVTDETVSSCLESIPELPDSKFERYVNEVGIEASDAKVMAYDLHMSRYFDEMLSYGASAKGSVTWLTVELLGRLREGTSVFSCGVGPDRLADIVSKVDKGVISGKSAKIVLDKILESSVSVDEVITSMNLGRVDNNEVIEGLIEEVLSIYPEKLSEYKGGKTKLFGFFIGQVMKLNGNVDPKKLNELLSDRLC